MSGAVHLHTHSVWSLLDGAITAEELPHLAERRGFEAIALTDHDSLLGAVRFSKACRDAGIKPIFGAELTLEDEHVTLLARNRRGYGNLCRLISDAHLSNERRSPRTTFEKLARRAEGLFVLSGCAKGTIAKLAAAGRMPEAVAEARRRRDVLGDHFRIEVFDHRGYGHRALRDRLLYVAKDAGVPAVATNDVHYAVPESAATHEVLHAIDKIVPLSRTQVLRGTSEYYLKDPDEMADLFWDVPEALEETRRIADECDFDLDLDGYHFPEVPIPAGETPMTLLARKCYDGIRHRYGRITRAAEDRIQHELQMIFKLGFASFFLLVADIVDAVKAMGIRCACRGSAAGSLVCYSLGISDVDPIRYDLLFERFMNLRREEMPDIDVDVESHRREEVLEYIARTYGARQTAVCCMVDTFRARMAIREVGKALGLPTEEIDLVAKAFPRIAAKDIGRAVANLPELKGSNLRAGQLEQLFELCSAIDEFPRHLALHPSGVILSSDDLADRVPMQESFQGFVMLQADKHDVEDLGLVKLDVLGVRMLSAIAHARDEVVRVRGERIDLDALEHDDPPTFDLIGSSRTLGCFQIESPGQRELLARFQPNRFEDLIVDISLFRPGPVKSDMVSPFLERRHGFESITHPHERLREILAETNGVIVYHEQVIRVIAAVTGCSLSDADFVRRHLDSERPSLPDDPNSRPARDELGRTAGHKGDGLGRTAGHKGDGLGRTAGHKGDGLDGPRSGVTDDNEVGRWFVARGIANGYTPEAARALWKEVFSFASFGFCKSHAAAFALPTYVSAYLKAHYTAEFLAGVLTHDPGMYPRRLIVADARQFGIAILPVDVNHSDGVYRSEYVVPLDTPARGFSDDTPDGPPASDRGRPGIRMSLSEVRDISEAEVDSIVEGRKGGLYRSLEDLWRRTRLSRPVLENLVHIGALDSIEQHRSRRELLWRAADIGRQKMVEHTGQTLLALEEPADPGTLTDLRPYDEVEAIRAELEVTGIDGRRHLMSVYEGLMKEAAVVKGSELRFVRNDERVWVAGVKVASQTPAIRSGQRIIFVTLDDATAPIDVTVFERFQARTARTVFHSWLLLVRGVVRKRGGASLIHEMHPDNVGITVVAHEVFDLAQLAADHKAGRAISAGLGKQRRRQAETGLAASTDSLGSKGRMWHASGGSAGR